MVVLLRFNFRQSIIIHTPNYYKIYVTIIAFVLKNVKPQNRGKKTHRGLRTQTTHLIIYNLS